MYLEDVLFVGCFGESFLNESLSQRRSTRITAAFTEMRASRVTLDEDVTFDDVASDGFDLCLDLSFEDQSADVVERLNGPRAERVSRDVRSNRPQLTFEGQWWNLQQCRVQHTH